MTEEIENELQQVPPTEPAPPMMSMDEMAERIRALEAAVATLQGEPTPATIGTVNVVKPQPPRRR